MKMFNEGPVRSEAVPGSGLRRQYQKIRCLLWKLSKVKAKERTCPPVSREQYDFPCSHSVLQIIA